MQNGLCDGACMIGIFSAHWVIVFFLPDSNSWDEHVFELVLPKACMVGHVDFKFVLNSNITNIPQIQVTLLKNKAPGLGKVNGKKKTRISFKTLFLFSNLLFSVIYIRKIACNCVSISLLLFYFVSQYHGLFSVIMLECKLGRQTG